MCLSNSVKVPWLLKKLFNFLPFFLLVLMLHHTVNKRKQNGYVHQDICQSFFLKLLNTIYSNQGNCIYCTVFLVLHCPISTHDSYEIILYFASQLQTVPWILVELLALLDHIFSYTVYWLKNSIAHQAASDCRQDCGQNRAVEKQKGNIRILQEIPSNRNRTILKG